MLKVERFETSYEKLWDRFVQEKSVNGTFLQTRNFLNYHPKDRFLDHSLLVYDKKNQLCAVVPACEAVSNGQKMLLSHGGSTYGGFVVKSSCFHKAQEMEDLLEAFDAYWQDQEFSQVQLRMTPALFSREDPSLLEYFMKYHGYQEAVELSVYIDYVQYQQDVASNFNQNKRRLLKKMEGADLAFLELTTERDIAAFHDLLCRNLKKFDTKPVHTLPELLDLYASRLKGLVQFYGVAYQNELLAGCMCFNFDHRILHTQYLASDPFREEIPGIEPMTYLYYKVICQARQDGYAALSFGICTEDQGRSLNFGLLRNKASFGGRYSINRTFTKTYQENDLTDPGLSGNVYLSSQNNKK